MKKYLLYRQSLLPEKNWILDNTFNSYHEANNQILLNIKRGTWKIWKIEEIFDFSNINPQNINLC